MFQNKGRQDLTRLVLVVMRVTAVQKYLWHLDKQVYNIAFAFLYSRAVAFVTENLPHTICSCGKASLIIFKSFNCLLNVEKC